jgi:hypothetical protein
MLLIIRKSDAQVLARLTAWPDEPQATERAIAATARNHDLEPAELVAHYVSDPALATELDQAGLEEIAVTLDDQGAVTGLSVQPTPTLWLHVSLSGGDGDTPPGIKNDGADALTVNVALRAGPEPDAQLVPANGGFRVSVRDDSGAIYDVVKVSLSDGQGSFSYTTDGRPGVCRLEEGDLAPITAGDTTYRLRLANPVEFKVYREL